jgi:hypothetical protein
MPPMTRTPWLLALLVCAACTKQPTAYETLPQLKRALDESVESDPQNRQNSALVETISEERHLEGLTRLQVEEKVGRGDDCARHPLCQEKGFEDDDWYYEVGRQGAGYVRYRPALIVGFNRFGTVDRTYVLRVQ